jgi:hypothetical protein
LRERLFFSFIFLLLLVACTRQTTPFVVPQNAPQANEQVQPASTLPAQEIVSEDECEFDSDCGFGKRCDYPLCTPCVEGKPCAGCPKICMVITKEGGLREAQR